MAKNLVKFGRRIFLKALASLPLVGPRLAEASIAEPVVEPPTVKGSVTFHLEGLPLPIVHSDFWFSPRTVKPVDFDAPTSEVECETLTSETADLSRMIWNVEHGVRRWWR